MEPIVYIFPNFENCAPCEKDLKDGKDISSIWGENMLGYEYSPAKTGEYPRLFFSQASERAGFLQFDWLITRT